MALAGRLHPTQIVESYNERGLHLSIQMNTPCKVHSQKLQVNRQWKKLKRKATVVNHLITGLIRL